MIVVVTLVILAVNVGTLYWLIRKLDQRVEELENPTPVVQPKKQVRRRR
jgi:hypothetical protein